MHIMADFGEFCVSLHGSPFLPLSFFSHGFDGDGNSSATSDSNTYYEDDFSSSDDSSGRLTSRERIHNMRF